MADKIWIDEAAKLSPEEIEKLKQAWEKAFRGVHKTDLKWYWIPCDRLMPEEGRSVPVTCQIGDREPFLTTAYWTGDYWYEAFGDRLNDRHGREVTVLAWLDIDPLKGEQ